jgi:methyl-accepting chemotaxis protein
MDSRGVYMARSDDEFDRFAETVVKTADSVESMVGEWVKNEENPVHRLKLNQLEQRIRHFTALRRTMVQAGKKSGPDAARAIGESNPSIREEIKADLKELGEEHSAELASLEAAVIAHGEISTFLLLGLAAFASVAGVLLTWVVVGRSVISPIMSLRAAVQRLAEGDFDTPIPQASRADELGAMARGIDGFRETLADARRLEASAKREGNDRARRADAIAAVVDQFEENLGRIVSMLHNAVGDGVTASRTLEDIAGTSADRGANVAASAQEASENVKAVAAAAEELSASIHEIRSHVARSSTTAMTASEDAQRATAIVDELSGAVARIGDVVRLINDIAGQTNLLALNATIEAARAGEAGRGFAVVASEVKSLAGQTAKATDEIQQQIEAVQRATAAAVGAISGFGVTLQTVSGAVEAIAVAVEQQSSATSHIASNIAVAASGAEALSQGVDALTAEVDRTRIVSSEIQHTMARMNEEADRLRGSVDGLRSGIRAA